MAHTTITVTVEIKIDGEISEDDLHAIQSNMHEAVDRAYFNGAFTQDTEVEIELVSIKGHSEESP